MPWARLDDKAITNLKLRRLSHPAFRVWALGLVYCASELTDGFVPNEALSMFPLRESELLKAVTELCSVQMKGKAPLWSEAEDETGYVLHDYLTWNQSREKVLSEQNRKRANKESWKTRNGDARGTGSAAGENNGPSPSPSPSPLPSPSEKAPKLTKEDEQPSSPVKVLVDRYHDMLAKNLGIEKVDANWPKVATVLKRKIEEHTAKVVGPALTKFMADKDPFLVERAWEIGLFAARFNRYISKATTGDGGAAAGLAAAEETKQKLKQAFEDV